MKKTNLIKSFAFTVFLLMAWMAGSQTNITGTVTDTGGEPLIGANIIVKGTSTGTVSDLDGSFSLRVNQELPVTLVISYTGFTTEEVTVSDNSPVNVSLSEGIIAEQVVVSASRKREKVQEAPASVSVLTSRQLAASPQPDAVRNLITVPGVQLQQQSAARINIEMRAGSGIFGTSVFPIMDYRSLIGPGIGTFQSDAVGLSNIDIDRIEVVRGPGSALYGPGVASGVIHFITKDPIDHPGTTVQVGGGELNTFISSVRHAWANDKKTFGFKVNAYYNRGDEFTLDGSEGTFDAQGNFTRRIDVFQTQVIHPAVTNDIVDLTKPGEVLLTKEDLDPDNDGNMMQDFWENMAVNTTLEFRPQDDLTVFLSGGYNQASAVFYNDLGEGLSQQQEFWSQARLQKGGFFAQLFYVNNNGGTKEKPTFLYTTGNRSPVGRQQLEGQVQYNFSAPQLLNADFTAGVDYRQAFSETFHLVYGRNEDNDDYRILGGYLQGKFALGDKLDLVLAGRYDDFNFLDEGFFSPRAALVFKPHPKHTFRASFNRAGVPPPALVLNIDFPVNAPVPGVFDFWLAGQNEIHTFPSNPNIEFLNQAFIATQAGLDPNDPSVGGLLAALPDELPWGTPGLPLSLGYGVLNSQVLPLIIASLESNPATAPLAPAIADFLTNYSPSGFTGSFFGVNAFDQNTPLNELIPTNEPVVSTSNTIEFGYKGLIADKLGLTIDVYNIRRKGFFDFTQIAPLISLLNPGKVSEGLISDFQGNFTTELTNYLTGLVGDPNVAAAIAGPIAAGYIVAAQDPMATPILDQLLPALYSTGTVETNRVPQNDGIMHVAAGYRIFPDAELNYWGSDVGLEYYINQDFSVYGNLSWVSQTRFNAEDLGEPSDSPLSFSLNSPDFKYRLGLIYAPQEGIRANVSFQHDDGFFSNTGAFGGDVQEKNLVDAGVGYVFDNGLAIDLAVTNLFNNEYRAFNNMPKIGRRALARVTYTFGNKK